MLERREVGIDRARPDLGLPAPVERLDGGLEAGLARWREHRHDAQGEALADDRPDRVGVAHPAQEARVVVELGVAGQPEATPVPEEQRDDLTDPHAEVRPGAGQAAMEADGGQDPELRVAAQVQPVDDVEAVELDPTGGHVGQVPAGGRGEAPDPADAVEHAAPLEHPPDRAHRGTRPGQVPLRERPMDGERTELAEVARGAQLVPQLEDQVLEVGRDARRTIARR